MTMPAARNIHEFKKRVPRPLKISIPAKGIVQTSTGERVYEGRLEAIGEGRARIFFDHPLAEGTELIVLVEFKDRKNREIQFRYEGRVGPASHSPWYEVAVDFNDGVSISGKHARELLSELFPEET